jgi:co-chaperonin GroES (HSP10)
MIPNLDPRARQMREAQGKLQEVIAKAAAMATPPEADPDAKPSDIPWQPTRNHVVVRRVKRKKTGSGLLYLPDNVEAEDNVALVEAAGPAVSDERITRGAFVLIGEWGGTRVLVKDPVTGEDKTLLVLEDDEVLAIWQEPEGGDDGDAD